MTRNGKQLLQVTLMGASLFLSPAVFAGHGKDSAKQEKHEKQDKQASLRKAKDEAKTAFRQFIVDLFRWTAKAYSKVDNGERKEEIFFKFTKEEFENLHDFFERNRALLVEINRQNDLCQVKGQELIPQDVYLFIKANFALKTISDPIDVNVMLQKMVGCNFGGKALGGRPGSGGLIDKVSEFNLSDWQPIKNFINQFKDTLTLDSRVANHLGRILLPLLKHYFDYMDPISRLRLFKELIEDSESIELTGEHQHDLEQVAIKIFQNTGPVLIKFLQQLQEEVSGETPISKVLDGLKRSKPMFASTAEEISRSEFASIYGMQKVKNFTFNSQPLGIASIAQTHKFTFADKTYVIKILKTRVKEVFEREKAMLARLLSDEKNIDDFDKGLKQSIFNMIAGIAEEMDLAHEMANINTGNKVYTNPEAGVKTVSIPDLRTSKEATRPIRDKDNAALVMSLAPGQPLGNILRTGGENELRTAYELVQSLYRQYLHKALNGVNGLNFYHGDLHRENIFIDLQPSLGKPFLTLIDFGNAGIIKPGFRSSIIQIMQSTRDTNTTISRYIVKNIENLGRVLQQFVASEFMAGKRDIAANRTLVNEYFASCFNPNGTVEQKMIANQQLSDRKDDLLALKKRLAQSLETAPSNVKEIQDKLAETSDSVDFINALLFNCLNGATSKLLTTLAEKNSVSEKLIVVFQELERNGISLPKEIIFFNKSKALLEGILTNIAQKLEALKSTYTYVEPEEIFDEVIGAIKK